MAVKSQQVTLKKITETARISPLGHGVRHGQKPEACTAVKPAIDFEIE